ncbi:MAG: periplasmic ligand-binding sensor domain-like protein [Bacteroidetes bacterium]|nr:periplasmic ligand-binding sensor domain-like protein [Bacteroidota bacterium]
MIRNSYKSSIAIVLFAVLIVAGLFIIKKPGRTEKISENHNLPATTDYRNSGDRYPGNSSRVIKEAGMVPVYGNWRTFTTKDGLPSDKAYTVRIDGDRVLVGTHDGMAVYENEKWKTYTTEDGLAHNGVVSIDVDELTGDVWMATLGGLTRWSGGKFETFNQLNSGMPNDLVYNVFCYGSDIWVATGGGAGHYDTRTRQWEIFTEMNAPMHEPWTYALSAGDGKVWIAAWGGGVIEYNTETKHFRDYVDPDGFMEIDLQPDDGVIHDITTATSYSDSILWVSTYFGMSRYDGKNWKGYFNHDSGLASNFINFIRAEGKVVFVCCDNGLSSTDGTTWVTYNKDENSENGRVIITTGSEKKEIPLSPSISHNFIIGVDACDDFLWIATSKGVCRGELIK